jgi:hypothetical protein
MSDQGNNPSTRPTPGFALGIAQKRVYKAVTPLVFYDVIFLNKPAIDFAGGNSQLRIRPKNTSPMTEDNERELKERLPPPKALLRLDNLCAE